MAWLTSNLQTLLVVAVGLVILALLGFFFPGFPISYALVFGIGVLVGVGELVSRYRDAPEQAVRTKPAVIYVLLNATAAVVAFVLVLAFDVVKGTGDGPAITRVLLAGFGAMAFFRTSIFTIRVGDQDVSIGPVAFLQIVLHAADRAVDRVRADARAKAVAECMAGVSFDKAQAALPAFCMALMQNVPAEEQNDVGDAVKILQVSNMDDQTKAKNLGLVLMKVVGQKVLLTAVENLAAQIKTTTSVTIEPPALSVKVGISEQLRAHCRDSTGIETAGKGVTWTSAHPPIAAVGADGRVRGVTTGSTSITATVDGSSDTIAVVVTAA
jgi:Bacterial Ig-like domain (group 2)